MNFSRISRAGRAVPGLVIAAATAAVLLSPLSCADDVARPTHGTVEVRLSSPAAGGFVGARIESDGDTLVAHTSSSSYLLRLPAGPRTLSLHKECAGIHPEPEVSVTVEAGRTTLLSWEILPGQAIEVTSSIPGASIILNGEDTGEVTPATLGCAETGLHTVQVRLVGATAGPDSVRTVEVTSQTVSVFFDLAPIPQQRGVLLEVFTATYCPNCPVADAAAENLHDRPEIASRGYAGVQVHASWGGSDPFYNEAGLLGRLNLFDAHSGLPKTFFSGTNPMVGVGGMTEEQLTDVYAARVSAVHDCPLGHPASLYWLDVDYTPGVEITGTVRIMLLRELSQPCALELWVLNYKDGLTARSPHGWDIFYKVVREYRSGGALPSLGLSSPGDYRDVQVRFALDWDVDRQGGLWPEDAMGLIAFVQDMSTREIFQMAHIPVP